ncbi:MAG: pentapeptide repeat-containing protein [Cyanobacteria bacterium J06621_12]
MQNLEKHYKVLGLEPGASLDEVNQAYKDLVFIWHPDRVPQDNERLVKKSVAKIQQINEARDSLRSYHRKHKSTSSKSKSKSKSQTYSTSASQNSRQPYRADSRRANERPYSDRYSTYRPPYSDRQNRQQTYSRPYSDQTKSYGQARHWNYRDYYASPRNPESNSRQDGYKDFRQTSSSSASRPAEKAHRRPYSKDLRGADLSKSNFKERDFSGRDLSQADLSYSDLSDTFLHKIILEEANLQGANLKGANLLQANLRNADLREANLIGADLSGSDLSGANLSGAKVGFNKKIMVKITAVKLTGATLPDGSIHP